MIDITAEHLIAPREYCEMRPPGRNGRPMHIATAYRHIFNGVRGIKLEHVKIGSQIYTSREAVQRFIEAMTDLPRGKSPSPAKPPRTTAARSKAFARAEAALDDLGV